MSLRERSAKMRHFTRFYTQKAGVLKEALLGSKYNLTEARLLYELDDRLNCSAKELAEDLELDPGYLSRTLSKLQKQGLVEKTRSPLDGRRQLLFLTAKGKAEFETLDQLSSDLFAGLLNELSTHDQERLLGNMQSIERLLSPREKTSAPFLIRPHRPGDMGWIISAHGRIYFEEYGWNSDFEADVAEIAKDFLRNFKPGREICFLAEQDSHVLGSAMVVEADQDTAKLRLVILDKAARGSGMGKKLVQECISFARNAGYSKMTLWTNKNLIAAVELYKRLGFSLIEEEPHHSYGHDLIGQYWSLDLK